MAMSITATQAHAKVDQNRKTDQIHDTYHKICEKVKVGLTRTTVSINPRLPDHMIPEIINKLKTDGFEVDSHDRTLTISWNLPSGVLARNHRDKTMEIRKNMMDKFIAECENSINGAIENRKTAVQVMFSYDLKPFTVDLVYEIEKNGFETEFSESNGYQYLVIRW